MQEMVKIMAQQVAVMDGIPLPLEEIPQNNPVQIITQADLQDIITKDEPDLTDIINIKDEIADVISTADSRNYPNSGFTQFVPARNDVPDEVSWTDTINIPPNNLIPNLEDIGLIPPVPTGNRETDKRNYNEYLDTLQQIRPDLFISEDEESDNDSDVVVVTLKVEPKTEPDFTPFVDVAAEFLGRTLEDSLELAVSHGKLNEGNKVRHLSELNDPKYKYFRQNNNPLDVVYREKAKFDVQNPIIGVLLKEINKGKLSKEEYLKKNKNSARCKRSKYKRKV